MRRTAANKKGFGAVWRAYQSSTDHKLKIIDCYLLFVVATLAIQILYILIAGFFPRNSALGGLLSCTGSAVLGVVLRAQVNPDNLPKTGAADEAKFQISSKSAFGEFLVCHAILHVAVFTMLG